MRASSRHTLQLYSMPPGALLAERRSEITAEGKRITKLDQILLNGNNVALVYFHPLHCLGPSHTPSCGVAARPGRRPKLYERAEELRFVKGPLMTYLANKTRFSWGFDLHTCCLDGCARTVRGMSLRCL